MNGLDECHCQTKMDNMSSCSSEKFNRNVCDSGTFRRNHSHATKKDSGLLCITLYGHLMSLFPPALHSAICVLCWGLHKHGTFSKLTHARQGGGGEGGGGFWGVRCQDWQSTIVATEWSLLLSTYCTSIRTCHIRERKHASKAEDCGIHLNPSRRSICLHDSFGFFWLPLAMPYWVLNVLLSLPKQLAHGLVCNSGAHDGVGVIQEPMTMSWYEEMIAHFVWHYHVKNLCVHFYVL